MHQLEAARREQQGQSNQGALPAGQLAQVGVPAGSVARVGSLCAIARVLIRLRHSAAVPPLEAHAAGH